MTDRFAAGHLDTLKTAAGVAGVALLLRVSVAVAVRLLSDGTLFLDDRSYLSLASLPTFPHDADPSRAELIRRAAAFLWPVHVILRVGRGDPLLAQLFVAFAGAGAAGLTAGLAQHHTSRRVGLVAGALVALLPSQVLFSALVLKDAVVWLLVVATAAVASAIAGGGRSVQLPLAGAGAALMVVLGHVRPHAAVVASWAWVVACCYAPRGARLVALAGAVALLIGVPLASGSGAAGIDLVRLLDDAPAIREENAGRGRTRFVPDEVGSASSHPLAMATVPEALAREARALGRGVIALVLRPYPWEGGSGWLRLAAAESLIWYALLAAAAAGWRAVREQRAWLAFGLAYGALVTLAYAMIEGSLGTAFRHRGELVWVVAILVGLNPRLSRPGAPP